MEVANYPSEQRVTKQSGIDVLLVEDSRILQKINKQLLLTLGCFVSVASSGEEAVRLSGEKQFDLIFMDINLPGCDGVEACKRIGKDKRNAKTPVIALTSHDSDAMKMACFSAGMVDFLTKPAPLLALEEMMSKWVYQRLLQKKKGNSPACDWKLAGLANL